MTSIPPGARIVGTLARTEDGKGAVRMEDLYDTDIDDLWSALTDPRRLARWIADVAGDLRLGGQIHARFTSTWEGPGRIDVCQAPRRLSYPRPLISINFAIWNRRSSALSNNAFPPPSACKMAWPRAVA